MTTRRAVGRAAAALALLAGLAAGADTDPKSDDDAKSGQLATSALVEPRWSWRSDQATCPPPQYFYDSCHATSSFVAYRRLHPQYQLQHDAHFRPSAGPPPRAQPPTPGYPAPRPSPTLITFVAEEARRGGWWSQGDWAAGGDPSRGQFGRHRPGPGWRTTAAGAGSAHPRKGGCYRLQRRDERLDNHILQVLQSRDLRDCEEACNRDRHCVSFNFRTDPVQAVCELTDMDSYAQYAEFRPIIGWDFYERDASSYCSGWDNNYYDTNNFGYAYCSLRVRENTLLNVNAVRRDITTRDLAQCEQACRDEYKFRCETFSFGVAQDGRTFSCLLTDLRISELSPRDMESRTNFQVFDFHGNGRECDRPNDMYDYRHGHLETCSGRPCVRGPCRIDRSGGYWYCFTDSAEAVWDYCCDPDSPCQLDRQMDMQTCHVTQQRGLYRNAGLDTAWRPCSHQQDRFAYLTRNSTDHAVDDREGGAGDAALAHNQLLETIDLEKERSKPKH